jgi:uncharacterized membrane protein YbhN (UPF0104 family)
MVVSYCIVVAFLVWAGWYIYQNSAQFLVVRQISWVDLLMLSGLFLAILACNGLFIELITRTLYGRLGRIECVALATASSFANYFLPFRGGAGLRAIYLSRLHGFPLADFVTSIGVLYLMHVVANGVVALAGMVLLARTGGSVDPKLMLFFALMTVGGLVFMVLDLKVTGHADHFIPRQISRVLAGWKRVRSDVRLFSRLWILTLTLIVVTALQVKMAFAAVSVDLTWYGALVYAASKNVAMLISITPGSLGIVEGVSIYLGNVLNYTTAQALLVQGLIRVVSISVLLVTGPVAFLILRRRVADLASGGFGGRKTSGAS